MRFQGVSLVEEREGFVAALARDGANRRAVCRAYGKNPNTAYKWLRRAAAGEGLADRSRRPHRSPDATGEAMVAAVIGLRREHPSWGGRKLHHVLVQRGLEGVPQPSTITGILHRHGLIAPEESARRRPFCRFERAAANEMWQMDFKGHFPVGPGRCHPLTVIDDHSRYAVALEACADERGASVRPALETAFACYGLPDSILVDNGPPWGTSSLHRHTELTAWLMRLDVEPIHCRPYHPQTRGKNERFNGTLAREVVAAGGFTSLGELQDRFDRWRAEYNHLRPHQGIGDVPPARRFRPSARAMPSRLPALEYGAGCRVRRVQDDGRISFQGRNLFVSLAFAGHPIGLSPTDRDGVYDIRFGRFTVGTLNVRTPGADT